MRGWSLCVALILALALPAAAAPPARVTTYGKGWRFSQAGWTYIHIEGEPFERGEQHGYLAADLLRRVFRSLRHLTYQETGKPWSFFVQAAETLWAKRIDPEYIQEMKGIAAGARRAGLKITWQDILAWNGRAELIDYWWPTVMVKYRYLPRVGAPRGHCSAFIATGQATGGRGIVMAHNSWDDFQWGQFLNLVLDIKPARGHRIFMQSMPGYIHSMSDFFVTAAGLVGTETTIGGFSLYDPEEDPEFYRVRKAMQYADTLERFVALMKKRNNGGYANSWLLGDVKTGEIMRLELGLKFSSVTRKKDGWFIGFNAPFDPRIRNLECSNTGFADIRRHQGARRVRLGQLMRQYQGRLDAEAAKRILADHYDVYLGRVNPSSRTVDGHYELDPRAYMSDPSRPKPYQPRGAVDGKVLTSALARKMSFWARWGNSSGMPFDAEEFLRLHPQWDHLRGYLFDRPAQPWVLFTAGQKGPRP